MFRTIFAGILLAAASTSSASALIIVPPPIIVVPVVTLVIPPPMPVPADVPPMTRCFYAPEIKEYVSVVVKPGDIIPYELHREYRSQTQAFESSPGKEVTITTTVEPETYRLVEVKCARQSQD